ncbi:hypothetical protein QE197_00825 [Arsenophonus nasoniae]|uniref:Uncharacterized protein n=1 Tax=Arsenophonus nasoniae TaxID=638 RepID=D2TZW4_9GAMM|nr:hypothetical protein [Arsenophonus nasoniae]QBY41787.1 hypothetical protein ArsFIN_03160 [Arsenophonus nasoniae]WGM06017.1 hypothetical protein QE258_01090 [Arsenophonus nasoniae]WGM10977.1 hypothetical protein QE197_00825 [Arsenophonus nasoniae]WGM15679.1 hypothetical protein QE193_00810 [Arsenophonus nasoniae]CBA73407.1 hypothetical protein ARN_17490 [Arsenophonus nasoniae]
MVEINRLTANKAHPFTAVKQDISADNNLVNQLTALQKNIIQLVNSVIENEQKKRPVKINLIQIYRSLLHPQIILYLA